MFCMRSSVLLGFGLMTAILCSSGCGSDGSTAGSSSGMPEAGDGKLHPPGNGTHESEAAACVALRDAHSAQAQHLLCASTSRGCPDLLIYQFTTACMEYDQGSVQGCVTYYNQTKTCADLAMAVDNCVITPFPGSEPAGCPTK
jgi:hypothetical protein